MVARKSVLKSAPQRPELQKLLAASVAVLFLPQTIDFYIIITDR